MQALENENWIIRNSAAICIGEMINYDIELLPAISPLIAVLKDSQPIVKGSAAITLGKIYKKIKSQEHVKNSLG